VGTRSLLASRGLRAALPAAGVLACCALVAGCGWKGSFLELTTEQKLASAQADLADRKWSRAVEKFRILAGVYRGAPQFPEVQYGLGKAYAGLEDIPAAERELSVVVRDYPASPWADDALFTIAEAYGTQIRPSQLEQSGTLQAIEKLRDFLRRFPDSERVPEAQALLLKARGQLAKKEIENGRLYLKLGDGQAAGVHFETVLRDYPDTEWAAEARFGIARAFCKEGDTDQAKIAFQAVIQQDPNSDFARKSLEQIKRIDAMKGCS
jgi:outer membrane protein assembly factor BamD